MTIYQLTSNDFESPGGRVMKLRKPGLQFVMFKSQGCPHCITFSPHFEALSQKELRVKFSYADVKRYRQIVGMAQTTQTPIKGVPMFILYVNGAPFAKYTGKHNASTMLSFLNVMISRMGMSQAGPSNFGGRNPSQDNQQVRRDAGIGLSQQELRTQKEAESKIIPDGVIPYNAAYMAYLPINQNI